MWTPEQIALLGTKSDSDLSLELGIDVHNIRSARYRLSIPACPGSQPARLIIPDELKSQLGKLSDSEIARRMNVSQSAVSRFRREHAITPIIERSTLPEGANAMLGTMVDAEIAERYGVTRSCVFQRRSQLGIESAFKKQNTLPADVVAQLGKKSDAQVSKESGYSVVLVRKARVLLGIPVWTDVLSVEEIAILGTASDREVAKRLGRSASHVWAVRTNLRIPPYRSRKAPELNGTAALGSEAFASCIHICRTGPTP
jgi:transcriptional regulator with XRE-family HTH domain